ncbi:MAG: YdcF family protein [Bdellovibrio sp.]|nr:MAG: YdcF family protein [Bdellovibrio sp.]
MKSWPAEINHSLLLGSVITSLLFLLFMRTRFLISQEKLSSWTEDTQADCAVVLTGGGQRVREGFALLARGQVRHLIISGVNPGTELRDLMTPWDLIWGPVRDRIILEKRSTTTYGNARQTLSIVEGLGCQKVAVITSALHMYRAYTTFRASYPETISLTRHAVPATYASASMMDDSTEVWKTIFYSLWAF